MSNSLIAVDERVRVKIPASLPTQKKPHARGKVDLSGAGLEKSARLGV